jgi:hypothetical protein
VYVLKQKVASKHLETNEPSATKNGPHRPEIHGSQVRYSEDFVDKKPMMKGLHESSVLQPNSEGDFRLAEMDKVEPAERMSGIAKFEISWLNRKLVAGVTSFVQLQRTA